MLPPVQVKYIDDLMRSDLLYWRDLWFGWLLLSTKLVVVGLILEGPELIHEFFSIRGRVRVEAFGASLQESHTPDWVKIVALLGWLLIVAGVAGEWITDAVISDADNNIQAFNNALLAEAAKEAGDAKSSAQGASLAARESRVEAEKARQKAGEVAKEADAIERQLGKVAKEQFALQWHINLVAKSVSPRLIDRKRFTQLMRGQPKASVEIWYEPNDEEAKFLAMQLNISLGKDGLGWDTQVGPFPDVFPR